MLLLQCKTTDYVAASTKLPASGVLGLAALGLLRVLPSIRAAQQSWPRITRPRSPSIAAIAWATHDDTDGSTSSKCGSTGANWPGASRSRSGRQQSACRIASAALRRVSRPVGSNGSFSSRSCPPWCESYPELPVERNATIASCIQQCEQLLPLPSPHRLQQQPHQSLDLFLTISLLPTWRIDRERGR
jgi:hypothetical protein